MKTDKVFSLSFFFIHWIPFCLLWQLSASVECLCMSVKELYLMNEPEIGISYHALPPITRNECG